MSTEHPIYEFFIKPQPETKIWRYMDFTKFVSLIDMSALFFPSAEILASSFDKYEGSISHLTYSDNSHIPQDLFKNLMDLRRDELFPLTMISSWHINSYESMAMWKLYLSNTLEGIAIQTTYDRLSASIDFDKGNVFIGKVRYVNYAETAIPINNTYYPFVFKRLSFEHEKELRAMIQFIPLSWKKALGPGIQPRTEEEILFVEQAIKDRGLYVNVDLKHLIETVYISPRAPKWFADLVRSVIAKYDYDFPVKQSDLDSDPLY